MVVNFKCGLKLQAIKVLKEELEIGLIEAKDCADNGQFVCTKEQLISLRPKLKEVGCSEFKVLNLGLFQVFLKDWI